MVEKPFWPLLCTEYRAGVEHWQGLLGSLTLVQSMCLIHHMMNVRRHLNLKCLFYAWAAGRASSDGGVCVSYISDGVSPASAVLNNQVVCGILWAQDLYFSYVILLLFESNNQRMTWGGKDLKVHPVTAPVP